MNLSIYLSPTYFLDYESEEVASFTDPLIHPGMSEVEKGVALYYAVRDGFRYNPYRIKIEKTDYPASDVIRRRAEGAHCIDKAILLTACCRRVGIPAALGYANVRNHIGTEKIEAELGTDVLVFHGFTQMWLGGRWVTATPAFNKELCEKQNVHPLEFDGTYDSQFQEYNRDGNHKFMEYLHYYGMYADHPFDEMIAAWKAHYAHFLEKNFIQLG